MAKYVIIGGVAGGATAAARLRRLDEQAQIILLERGEYISYANCGLPYYAGGIIKERSKLFVMTPEKFRSTLAVDVRTGHEATSIDAKAKTVAIVEKSTGRTYSESYDALVLSPGSEPLRPPIPGIDDPWIFTLRSVPDVDAIKERIDAKRPERAIIIGAGFIGLEMAENLRERGVFVTIVEALDQVMNVIDPEMAAIVHQHLKAKGVELYLSDSVTAFERRGDKIVVRLKSGKELPADMVILSIGVKPDTKLAREAGLELDQRGAILVDSGMRTSDPHIYAVGDAVATSNPLTGKPGSVPLAGPANKEARIAADNIAAAAGGAGAGTRKYGGAIGTSIAKVFDLTVACTGLSEKACDRERLRHDAVIVHPSSHAGYYPEAKPFSLKVVFDPDSGKLLGAQAVGYEGVDKRMDVLAAFLSMGAGVEALTRFEHAYAPPFASAKDPVNYAGFVAENIRSGLTRQARWNDVARLKAEGAFILDVRTPEEFALGHIEGAINISNTVLRSRLAEVPKDRFVLLYCGVGIRGYLAERILRQNGWKDLANLAGGWKTYEAAAEAQSNEGVYRPGFDSSLRSKLEPVAYAEGSGQPEAIAARSLQTIEVDACGLQCPGPIMRLKTEMDKAAMGTTLKVHATDPGFARDAAAWCRLTGNELLGVEEAKGVFEATIRKSAGSAAPGPAGSSPMQRTLGNEATLIVFSDDFDRALASFVIANGAAASGKKVTMFFTFWGLSVVKRQKAPRVSKDFMGRMFGAMLPKNSRKLSLSKMNFGGIGAAMMKSRMKAKKIDQLESMMESALKAGVRMTACQMSMDIMGVSREELMNGVEIGGVASYLDSASGANLNLFI
jgi:NADPH-dependent 2,4-dienoyl-CoA reductase/sulfur reductase-like enzyme/peroxiredoxin family protein/TusA-related sulfurtransferase/rhodanese-related sulfurtransferase